MRSAYTQMYKIDTQMPFSLDRPCLSLVVPDQAVEGAQLGVLFIAPLVTTLVPTILHECIYLHIIKHAHRHPKGSAGPTGQRDNVQKMVVDSSISEANPSPLHSHP